MNETKRDNCKVCSQELNVNAQAGLCMDCFKEMTGYEDIQLDILIDELLDGFDGESQ